MKMLCMNLRKYMNNKLFFNIFFNEWNRERLLSVFQRRLIKFPTVEGDFAENGEHFVSYASKIDRSFSTYKGTDSQSHFYRSFWKIKLKIERKFRCSSKRTASLISLSPLRFKSSFFKRTLLSAEIEFCISAFAQKKTIEKVRWIDVYKIEFKK